MVTIGGDGGIRRQLERERGFLAEAKARAAEFVRRLEDDQPNAEETAKLLVEVPRLPAEAIPADLRERIARAYPEGSEQRRKLGAALVSTEGGQPEALGARALEAKVAQALAKLGAAGVVPRPRAADAMERARSLGPFGGAVAPPVAESWRPAVVRTRERAPGLTNSVESLGRAESAVTALRRGLGQVGTDQGLWTRARAAAGDEALGHVEARFEGLRERVQGGLEAAAPLSGLVDDLRGEAAGVRQDIEWARELVPDVELDQVGGARSALGRAEGEMRAAEYGLQAYTAQQDIASSPAADGGAALTPELLEELRASGQVPPEILAKLESGEMTPEMLAQMPGAHRPR